MNNSFASYNIHATLGRENQGRGLQCIPSFCVCYSDLYGIDCIFWTSLTINCVLNKGLILFQKNVNKKLIIIN